MIRRSVLPLALLLALALVGPGAALAAESGTSGYGGSNYGSEPNKPTTTPATTTPAATTTTPATGTSPAKESKEPTTTAGKETSPAKAASKPTATTSATKATTLPFTGFDLRWSLAIGLLLIAAGASIIVVQRHRVGGR